MTSTPAALGLDYRTVTLTTTDGVELAAWYLPGTNRAGVVVMHGAGSTRSDVLDQSAALVGSGYAVVLIDARGHGDSHGTAMDFGWYGDLDIAAGTAFLASRADIDPGRIGVVGFSMGGEEAIGAAATDPADPRRGGRRGDGAPSGRQGVALRCLRLAGLAPGAVGGHPVRDHRLPHRSFAARLPSIGGDRSDEHPVPPRSPRATWTTRVALRRTSGPARVNGSPCGTSTEPTTPAGTTCDLKNGSSTSSSSSTGV